jgi:uncharacterized protein YhbP (UPF0306 family)
MKGTHLSTEDEWRRQAMALIDRQKTLVLATSDQNHPWAAPVYYVHVRPAFYFFSSTRSKHIEQALANNANSAALFSDADQWQQIEGIQMVGRIKVVRKKMELLRVTTHYLKKFPMAKSLLAGKENAEKRFSATVSLYAFQPERVYYMNNRTGLGTRIELSL